jgi:secreted PhoX family phosphatase
MASNGQVHRQYLGYEEIDSCSNPDVCRTIGEIIQTRLTRRSAIRAMAAAAAGAMAASAGRGRAETSASSHASTLTFEEIPHPHDRDAHVAPGYELDVLLRWGDPVCADAPSFDIRRQTAAAQARQFGYNCDFTAFLPLPAGSKNPDRGLLCVNHEYTDTNLMFPGITSREALQNLPRELVEIEMAAMGHSVVEIERVGRSWRPVSYSAYNRRITALDTPVALSGPAAGHPRLCTSADPSGRLVAGTLNNCGGGVTPWGTLLICEENFDQYFSGDAPSSAEAANHQRYGLKPQSEFSPAWARHHVRFDVSREPHEPNRFGWVVEFDPYHPHSIPVKRTALGRFKHEGAGIAVGPDGRVAVYSGDDERFEFVYKFVTRGAYRPDDPVAKGDLLDDGTLHAAQFHDDGRLAWLPLVYGYGPLTSANGFHSQADVLIEARRAASLLGATPMDRPEDVEVSPTTGRVYVMLTNNSKRETGQIDAANPRPKNVHGHILELIPPGEPADHAAGEYRWNVLLRGGDPARPQDGASYHPEVSANGWLSCPDNAAFDGQGRLWIATDNSAEDKPMADGVYACDVVGAGRALTRQFFAGPRGSEVSGISLTPDDRTMFISVQHPGEERNSDFGHPSTLWPDFRPGIPPRPSVVAIVRRDGREIGA